MFLCVCVCMCVCVCVCVCVCDMVAIFSAMNPNANGMQSALFWCIIYHSLLVCGLE